MYKLQSMGSQLSTRGTWPKPRNSSEWSLTLPQCWSFSLAKLQSS